MAKKPITHIVVAGSAEIEYDMVADLLSDFLLIDTDDEKEFRFFLPADSDYLYDAAEHTAEWLTELKEGFTAVRGILTSNARRLIRRADDVIEPEGDADLPDYLIDLLKDAISEGHEAYLLLAWGESDEAPDEQTSRLLELAIETGVPVKDLTAGLDDLGFEEEVEEVEEDAPEAETEEAPAAEDEPATEELVEDEQELEEVPASEPADEAQADVPAPELADAEFPDLKTTLAFVAQYLDGEDRRNAAKNLSRTSRSPLNCTVRHHLEQLLAAEAPMVTPTVNPPQNAAQNGPESAQEPLPDMGEEITKPRRGKARDVDSDVVKVLINEKDRTIRLSPGRGRPKKGEEAHEMTRAEYQKMLDSGEYTPF